MTSCIFASKILLLPIVNLIICLLVYKKTNWYFLTITKRSYFSSKELTLKCTAPIYLRIPSSNPLTLTLSPTWNPLQLSGLTGAPVLAPDPDLDLVDIFCIMGQVSSSSQHSLKFNSSVLEHLEREYIKKSSYGTSRPFFYLQGF